MIGQLLNSIGQVWSQRIASKTAERNTDLTNQANRELAEYQYQKNLENWHMQNAYNTPEAQMKRFKDAGLNPNLIYGQGNAGNASEIKGYQAPRMEYNYKPSFDPLNVISAFQNFQLQRAQIDNVKADTELKSANAQYRSESMKDALDLLYERRLITSQQREKMATELGWYNADIGWTPQRKGQQLLESQLTARQENIKRTRQDTERLFYDTKMKEAMSNFYDINFWSKIAQGFGLKLPSMNLNLNRKNRR